MEWMLLPYRRYFDFSDRSRRKEFWMFFLFVFIIEAIIFSIIFSQMPFTEEAMMAMKTDGPSALLLWGFAFFGIFGLVTIIPGIAVEVRRFHDQDKSGWMVLLNLVPALGWLIVLIFMFIEGTKGPNHYGPDPKDPAGAPVFV